MGLPEETISCSQHTVLRNIKLAETPPTQGTIHTLGEWILGDSFLVPREFHGRRRIKIRPDLSIFIPALPHIRISTLIHDNLVFDHFIACHNKFTGFINLDIFFLYWYKNTTIVHYIYLSVIWYKRFLFLFSSILVF